MYRVTLLRLRTQRVNSRAPLTHVEQEQLGIKSCGGVDLFIGENGELFVELQDELLDLVRSQAAAEREESLRQERINQHPRFSH